MTEREYRQDDETRGYCPTCGRELAALDMAARGVCEEHGRVFADWSAGHATFLRAKTRRTERERQS